MVDMKPSRKIGNFKNFNKYVLTPLASAAII
jgi:hypothetical protein